MRFDDPDQARGRFAGMWRARPFLIGLAAFAATILTIMGRHAMLPIPFA